MALSGLPVVPALPTGPPMNRDARARGAEDTPPPVCRSSHLPGQFDCFLQSLICHLAAIYRNQMRLNMSFSLSYLIVRILSFMCTPLKNGASA